jgi:hypothetical protein
VVTPSVSESNINLQSFCDKKERPQAHLSCYKAVVATTQEGNSHFSTTILKKRITFAPEK